MGTISTQSIPKPYPDYPLFPHAKGSWTATIDGRHVSFGPTRSPANGEEYRKSWQAALKKYEAFMKARAHGEALAEDPTLATLREVVNRYLSDKHERTVEAAIDVRTFAESRAALKRYVDAIGGAKTIRQLEADPTPIREHLKVMKKHLGIHAFNRHVRAVCSMWNWVGKASNGALGRPFRWMDIHEVRPIRDIRRQKREDRADGARDTWRVEEIAALIRHAHLPMKTIILLGYFAGYGNTDISELPKNALTVYQKPEKIHFHGRADEIPAGYGLLTFPRPKTEMYRYAIVPPLVVEAIREVEQLKRPVTDKTKGLMFRTEAGSAMVSNHIVYDANNVIEKVHITDNVGAQFSRVVARLGTCERHGIVQRKPFVRGKVLRCPECDAAITKLSGGGFYALRHTATTFASSSGASSDARDLFEGHSTGSVRQSFYLDPKQMHDLLLITRELCSRLDVAAAGLATRSPAPASSIGSITPAEAPLKALP